MNHYFQFPDSRLLNHLAVMEKQLPRVGSKIKNSPQIMLKKCFGQNNLSKFSNLRKISTGNKTPIAFHKKLMMSSSFCDSSP